MRLWYYLEGDAPVHVGRGGLGRAGTFINKRIPERPQNSVGIQSALQQMFPTRCIVVVLIGKSVWALPEQVMTSLLLWKKALRHGATPSSITCRRIQLDLPCVSGVRFFFAAFLWSNFTFFSSFEISRAFPICWRSGYLILVTVEKVNILISFNIGFLESVTVDSDSEDHVYI